MVAPVQDWGTIDESNLTMLRNDIPLVRGSREAYESLNSALDILLEVKGIATKDQIYLPELPRLIRMYTNAVTQGKHLRRQKWWKRIRNMRDWEGSEAQFKTHCQRVWNLANQTSCTVHEHAGKPKETVPRGGSVDQAEVNLAQQHNQHVAQSSSQNSMIINRLPKETIQLIVELSTTKVVELLLCGRLGGIPQNVTQYYGCIVGAGRRAAPTVNFGGRNNRGSAVNTSPSSTEVEGNGADDIDDISDDESQYDSAIDASSVRPSISTISLEVQDSDSITTSMRSLRVTYPGHHR
ncbi:uncharacterized protein EDB93DRAFT_1144324 [Suillus bovinus]|uniref:uncharacterized protein n=1 Tax=Suillus bovinus TaxID=48563 RepID=UPI001B87FD52|nr:uncharacterized protein EDB93DRAFT_1144324 [Suillus bovinus]KAG2148697.1 hypothetical protein EDB93DRAFT_1144324 [Suillus bovinus]